jgi:pilus assembly protein Flp/PilA
MIRRIWGVNPATGISSACGCEELLMCKVFVRFLKEESAATAIEYGLIAAGISVAIIAVVNGLGSNLNTKFSTISTQLK